MANATTMRKRIAAIAAAAVGAAIFTAAPALAAVTDLTANVYQTVAGKGVAASSDMKITTTGTGTLTLNLSGPTAGLLFWATPSEAETCLGTPALNAANSSSRRLSYDITYTACTAATLSVSLTASAPAGSYAAQLFETSADVLTYSVTKLDTAASAGAYLDYRGPETASAGAGNIASLDIQGGTGATTVGTTRVTVTGAEFFKETPGYVSYAEGVAPYLTRTDIGTTTRNQRILIAKSGTVTVNVYAMTVASPVTYAADPFMSISFYVYPSGADATGTYKYSDLTASGGSTDLGITYLNSRTTSVARFKVTVVQRDEYGDAIHFSGTKKIDASLVGNAGSLGNPDFGSVATRSIAAMSANSQVIDVWADGRVGESTLSVAVNGVTQETYRLKFVGQVAKLVAVVNNKFVADNNTSTAAAISVVAYDKADNKLPNVSITASSSAPSKATVADGVTASSTVAGTSSLGVANFAVVGQARGAVTITFSSYDIYTGVISTASADLTVSGGVASDIKWAFDKAEYTAGEKATITFTLKDSDGTAVGDGSYTIFKDLATTSGVVGAVSSAGGFTLPTAFTVENGTAKAVVFMPTTSGTVTVSGTLSTSSKLATALQGAATSISATVAKSAAETEAAKATAAVAAVSATVTQLQTAIAALVASTTATLTALTAKINKIMKKLNIK